MSQEYRSSRGQEAASRALSSDSLPKFTPGPWVIVDHDFVDEVWIGAEHPYVGIVTHAAVRSGCEEAEELGDMTANVNLISAAPELYEALHCLLEDPRFEVAVGGNPFAIEKMLDDARAALAKARGERP